MNTLNTSSHSNQNQPSTSPYVYLLVSIILFVLSYFGLYLVGNSFETLITTGNAEGYPFISDYNMVGIMFIIWIMPFGFIYMGYFAYASMLNKYYKDTTRVFIYICLAVLNALIAAHSMIWLITPQIVFKFPLTHGSSDPTINTFGPNHNQANRMSGLWGGMIFTISFSLFWTFIYLSYRYFVSQSTFKYSSLNITSNEVSLQSPLQSPLQARRTKSEISFEFVTFTALLVIIGCCLLCSMSFSSMWNNPSSSYFIVGTNGTQVSASLLKPETATVNSNFAFKLYTDVAVFYFTMIGVACLAIVAHLYAPIRRTLSLRLTAIKSTYFFEGGLFTIGELIMSTVMLGLFIFWVCYWPQLLSWRENLSSVGQGVEVYFKTSIFARVTGHLAVLCMSLLMFPITRNSLWTACLGVSYERTLSYHRYLGTLTYLLSTLHMLIWFVKWRWEDIFLSNLFTLNNFQVANVVLNGGFSTNAANFAHFDNFTIITAEIAWILMTIMVFLAIFRRPTGFFEKFGRTFFNIGSFFHYYIYRYELFYYTHQLAVGIFITVISHAWSSWFFLLPPSVFWILDRMLRLTRTQAYTTVAVDAGCGDITRLIFPNSFEYQAGQYVWLNIPSISSTEWHPFSISSYPGSSNITLHIKNVGDETFTGKISKIASEEVEVLIDGPYGKPPYFQSDVETLVLVAGGIGITPLISIFMDLYYKARSFSEDVQLYQKQSVPLKKSFGSLRRVVLLWTVKDDFNIAPFAEQLWAVRQNNILDMFDIFIHVTHSNASNHKILSPNLSFYPDLKPAIVNFISATAHQGRPNLPVFFESTGCPKVSSTLVFACGPEALVNEASSVSESFGFKFHSEAFKF